MSTASRPPKPSARRTTLDMPQLVEVPLDSIDRDVRAKRPPVLNVLRRLDALFDIEREINGVSSERRKILRNERSRPQVAVLEAYLRQQRAKLSGKNETAKAIDYSLKRWKELTRFVDDGDVPISNNWVENHIRPIAMACS